MAKPHTEIGQKGRNRGRTRPRRRLNNRPRQQRPRPPAGLPETNMPNLGGMPNPPPAPPNFLPNTPGFERDQTNINDDRMRADTAYSTGSQLIPAQFNVGMARLGTDQGYAEDALMENLAERGIVGSTHQDYLYGKDISTPFGRARQDLGFDAAGAYSGLASQYGNDLLGGARSLYDAYLERAGDAFEANPLGQPLGGYNVPNLPSFSPIYEPNRGGGRTRRRRRRRRGGNR